ncbi:MAG: DUF1553 domain-containing protein [Planctomycetes bacterium]|nr:DUF1553 domain-containing protein [Planctomycetota bacterium]
MPAPVRADDSAGIDFFEKRIRPVLVQHCYPCHSATAKIKGGLRLDVKSGWVTGGDTGPAIQPGKVEESLLIAALRAEGDLKMPPAGKLPQSVIDDFTQWVNSGAPDPRTDDHRARTKKRTIDLASESRHWAYRPVTAGPVPTVSQSDWPRSDIDRFILSRLEARSLSPNAAATREVLARRLAFDLLGLPPTPDELADFLGDTSPDAWEQLVDRWLERPEFGERWGRHWLDVVRYADSLTLRGFVFKQAWRYRDYVIDAFNRDLPFDQFLREQVAGDLLPAESLEERARKLVATTVLMLGNTNLEEQDKQQLELDVVDEQLDLIGRGFLAQTITCARCHDHQFDPIPTRDYYALAGILKNAQSLEHENVSKWLEIPLPLAPAEDEIYRRHEETLAMLQQQLQESQQELKRRGAGPEIVAVGALSGVVIDDAAARQVGDWQKSQYTKRYIGDGYVHDGDGGKGMKTLTFDPDLPETGTYEVRFAYTPGDNRSAAVPVTVFSAAGEKTIVVNERLAPPLEGRFISLGEFRFERGGQSFVIVSNEGTTGHVIADAVQFLPVGTGQTKAPPPAGGETTATANSADSAELQQLREQVKSLEQRVRAAQAAGPKRPTVMTIRERPEPTNLPVLLRGNVHQRGTEVPRGFLQVATSGENSEIPATEGGRRQLAEWLTRRDNPLTARVIVNRVWHWVFGAGLVRTTDNFGTTGESPSHPELLDHLTVTFMEDGWSIKRLIRRLVLSRTYQMSSTLRPEGVAADPENRWLWRAHARRLDAECLRDALLVVGGNLRPSRGGPAFPTELAADFGYVDDSNRRSVYIPVFRNALPPIYEAFDFADPSLVTGQRNTSTVSTQALYLLNHPFVKQQALLTARRILTGMNTTIEARLETAWRLVLGRSPTAAERMATARYLAEISQADPAQSETAWAQVVQALFATIDFRYVH